jgi:hypothetical protein
MSDDFDPLGAMLGDEKATPATVEPKPEAEPAKEPAAEAGQPRDPHGRFASKAETQPETPTADEAAPVPVAETPPPAPQKPPLDLEQIVPYIKERERRQAEKARADKAEARLREIEQQQSAQPVPNPLDDPDGYTAHFQEQRARERIADRVNFSELIVRQSGKYQPEEIDAALAWGMQRASSDEGFRQRAVSQTHPVEWTIREYKRDQLLSQIGDKDPKEWARELLAAEQSPQPSPAAPQPIASPTPQSPPTPSLATARSAGGMHAIPLGGDAAFEAMFQK